MRAYKNFAKFNSEQPFWQWIATIANHHCIDVLRRKNRTDSLFGDESSELDALPSVEAPVLTSLILSEASSGVNDAVSRLPDKYRVPLVLAYFNDLSYDQIAEQLKISRNHVGVLIVRAKQQLRTLLQSREDTA